jgi:hypothetical protein
MNNTTNSTTSDHLRQTYLRKLEARHANSRPAKKQKLDPQKVQRKVLVEHIKARLDPLLASTGKGEEFTHDEFFDKNALMAVLNSGVPYLDNFVSDHSTVTYRDNILALLAQDDESAADCFKPERGEVPDPLTVIDVIKVQVEYKYKRTADNTPYARRYAKTVTEDGGFITTLQGIKREARAAAVVRFGARDGDMKVAHPNILVDLFGDKAGEVVPTVLHYITNRTAVVKDQAALFGCSIKQAKQLWNKPLFAHPSQQTLQSWKEDIGFTPRTRNRNEEGAFQEFDKMFAVFRREVLDARSLFLEAAPLFLAVADENLVTAPAYKKKNREGSAFSLLLQTVEDVVLETIRTHINTDVFRILSAIFDGCLIMPAKMDFSERNTYGDWCTALGQECERLTTVVRDAYGWTHFTFRDKAFDDVPVPVPDEKMGYSKRNVDSANRRLKRSVMRFMNRKYCKVKQGSTPMVIHREARNAAFDNNPPKIFFQKVRDFHTCLSSMRMPLWDTGPCPTLKLSKGKENVSYWWYDSQRANDCDYQTFNPRLPAGIQPSRTKHNHLLYNTYYGLQVTPKKGEWAKIKNMIFHDLCSGQPEPYDCLIKWIALLVQKPWVKTSIIPSLIGPRAVGKGLLANLLIGSFFARGLHYTLVSDIKQLTGEFNLKTCSTIFVVLEEALFAGNKAAANILKSLAGDDVKNKGQKYADNEDVQNHSKYWINSNNWNALQSDHDDRNHLLLQVSDQHVGEAKYWTGIVHEIEHGGREAFLYHLLHEVDLQKYNPRKLPKCLTANAWQTKRNCLDGISKWLLESLNYALQEELGGNAEDVRDTHLGVAFYRDLTLNSDGNKFYIKTDDLWESFKCSHHRTPHIGTRDAFMALVLGALKSGKATPEDRRIVKPYRPGGKGSRHSYVAIDVDRQPMPLMKKEQNKGPAVERLLDAFCKYVQTPMDDVFGVEPGWAAKKIKDDEVAKQKAAENKQKATRHARNDSITAMVPWTPN